MLYVLSEVRPMMAPAVAPAEAGAAQCSRMSANGSTEDRSVSMMVAQTQAGWVPRSVARSFRFSLPSAIHTVDHPTPK